ncbi:hypothetical protein ACI65C_006834 [Semiaphis heraclei]
MIEVGVIDDNVQFWPVGERPQSYILIAGFHQHEHIIKDNLGFLYFKSKRTEEKVYLKCKENITRRCQATGSISSDENNKQFQLRRLHNHQVQPSNTQIRELRSTIGQRCVQQFARPYSARSIYVEAIVSHPEGAENYTFSQAAERMRQIRKSVFPPTPRNLQHFNELMQMKNNKHFNISFQKQPSLFYQGPLIVNGLFVGVLFCNTHHIDSIENELQNITISGCDGTFKTVPKTLDNDCYQLFTFQVIYRNVVSQIRFLENQNNLEFKQVSQNLKIRSGDSSRATIRNKNTLEIRRFMQDMVEDDAPDRILTFLRRAGHKVDGYITQQIGPYPGNKNFLTATTI